MVVGVVWRWSAYAQCVDLHPADEIFYLNSGLAIWRGESAPTIAWSSAYSLALALLHLTLPDSTLCFDAMNLIVRIAVGLTCWWAAAAVAPSAVAMLLGLWATTLGAITSDLGPGATSFGNVYAAGLAGCATALGFWLRGAFKSAAIIATVLVATRAEYATWTAVLFLGGWSMHSRGHGARSVVIALSSCALLWGATAAPSAKDRSWLAFTQHYARYAMEQRLLAKHGGVDRLTVEEALKALQQLNGAFDEPAAIIAEDFPGAASIAAAATISPDRFIGYVARNVREAPASLAPALGLPPSAGPWPTACLLTLAVLGAVAATSAARRGSLPHKLALPAGIACLVSPLPTILLTGMRAELSMSLFLCVAIGACVAVSAGGSALFAKWLAGAETQGVAHVACLVLAFAALPPAYPWATAATTPLRDAVSLLRGLPPVAERGVLAAKRFVYPLRALTPRQRTSFVESGDCMGATPETVAAVLRDRGVDVVLWNASLAFELRNAPSIHAELQGASWRVVGRRSGTIAYARAPNDATNTGR